MDSQNLSQGLQSFQVPGGNFQFTGVQVDDIQSAKQTLYTCVVDESGSTLPFRPDMSKCTQEVVQSLKFAGDVLMYRMVHFATDIREIHGFKQLSDCNPGDYSNLWSGSGSTSLYDAAYEAAEVTRNYAEQLAQASYTANGIIVVITDGCDFPGSLRTPKDVGKSFQQMVEGEVLESLMSILVGVNLGKDGNRTHEQEHVKKMLELFREEAGFTQFIPVEDASAKSLARLADFISRSVSSQSKSLGTGGPSQSLTF